VAVLVTRRRLELDESWTVRVSVIVEPTASVAVVPVIVPLAPAAGVLRVKVAAPDCVRETKVVSAGMASEKVTEVATLGPLLLMMTV
jgi:hypothetical protein